MLPVVSWISLVGLVISLGMAGYRTLAGPSTPDRIVALDSVSAALICLLIVGAILLDDPQYLAYAIVLSALNYVSTVALGKYIQRGGVIGHGDSGQHLPVAGHGHGAAGEPGPHPHA